MKKTDTQIKAHKNILKEEILQVIKEKFIEMLLDMVNQNIIKNMRKHKNK
jgi:uncharacterized radical SAM superfamily protein